MDGFKTNVDIDAVNPKAEKILNAKAHASYGFVLLTATSNFGGGAGVAPTGHYTGFIVGDNGVTISASTFWDSTTNNITPTEAYTTTYFPFTAGQYYPFPQGKTLTITLGNLMLIKEQETK